MSDTLVPSEEVQNAIRDGRVAQRILDDPIFRRAVAAADERFVSDWRNAPAVEDRERAHAKQAALREVVAQLETIAGDGYFEESRTEGEW